MPIPMSVLKRIDPIKYREMLDKKNEYSQEYRKKHNYMAVPGERNPYTSEEIEKMEERLENIDEDKVTKEEMGVLVRQIAEEFGRSIDGIWNWIYRNHSGKYRTPAQKKQKEYQKILKLKAEGKWDFSNNCPKPGVRITQIKVTSKEAEELDPALDELLSGNLSIEEFLNS